MNCDVFRYEQANDIFVKKEMDTFIDLLLTVVHNSSTVKLFSWLLVVTTPFAAQSNTVALSARVRLAPKRL